MNVTEEGSKVIIVASGQLLEWRLGGLIGRIGIVVENKSGPERKVKGCTVKLAEGVFMDELEWFVPEESLKAYVIPN